MVSKSDGKIRVLLADDHALFRDGLRAVLGRDPATEVVAEAVDGEQAVAMAKQHRPDIVLLDVSMPGRGGLETIAELKAVCRPGILVVSAHPEDRYATRCLRAGADGYLTKDRAADELLGAIHKVASGGKFVSASLAERLASEISSSGRPAHESLSRREFQTMMLIARGLTVSEVAEEIGVGVKSVSTFRKRVLAKLGLDNNAKIMLYVHHQGLADED